MLSKMILCGFTVLLLSAAPSFASRPIIASAQDRSANDLAALQKLFDEAQDAHAKGDLSRALALYDKVISLNPDLYQVHYQRALALRGQDRNPEAEAALRRTLELQPSFARAQITLSEILIEKRSFIEARQLLEKAIAAEPNNARAPRVMGILDVDQNRYAEAIEHLTQALRLGDNSASLLFDLARAEHLKGDRAASLASINRALQINPSDADALKFRSALHREEKNLAAAAADLEAAGKLAPSEAIAIQLASLYRDAADFEKALAVCQRELSHYPSSRALMSAEADALVRLHREDEARSILQKLIDADPKDRAALIALADSSADQDPAAAADLYRRALQADSNDAAARARYGATLLRLKRFGDAAGELNRVLQEQPEWIPPRRGLAAAYFELKRYEDAAREFKWLTERDAANALSYYFLAICFDKLQNLRGALSAYESFVAHADAATNAQEIENANLRIPQLKRLIEKLHPKKPEEW